MPDADCLTLLLIIIDIWIRFVSGCNQDVMDVARSSQLQAVGGILAARYERPHSPSSLSAGGSLIKSLPQPTRLSNPAHRPIPSSRPIPSPIAFFHFHLPTHLNTAHHAFLRHRNVVHSPSQLVSTASAAHSALITRICLPTALTPS